MKTGLFALALGATVPGLAHGATLYNAAALEFETGERQSAWGAGAASRIADVIPVGPAWNVSDQVGDIVGSVSRGSVPNPRRLAYNACRLIPAIVRPDCGSRPPATLPVVLDTRTGAEGTVASSGRVGLDIGYALDAGSVAARLEFDAGADLAPGTIVRQGEAFRLQTTSVFADGEMDSQSPTAEASIDVVMQANLSVSGQACLALAGCVSDTVTLLDIDEVRELISVDPVAVRYLDGFLPDFVELTTPLLDYSVSLEADLVTKKLEVSQQNNVTGQTQEITPVDGGPVESGINIELANINVQAPLLAQSTTKEAGENHLALSGQADFVSLRADLDGLLTYANALPPLGARVDILDAVSGSIDLIDAEFGPSIDVFQEFKVTPKLMVDLAFDRAVEIDGVLRNSFFGEWGDLPEFTLFGDTLFTPTFSVLAMMKSTTGLQFGLDFDVDVLKAQLSVGYGGISFFNAALGPLAEFDLPFDPAWARIAIFDDTFALGGFNTVAGESFMISATPVPLPAGVWLMLAGLGSLGLLRRYSAGGRALT
ncbi:VPLPA-CTERM sorting domain-containing protein [Palleronia sp. KMU-117]|uniref:VPLPA-CTERM sorting domain-containing protein n=1 Tax=Palleronia sp. KMU-117 TaxID=3434108 RepID=UPI003D73699A